MRSCYRSVPDHDWTYWLASSDADRVTLTAVRRARGGTSLLFVLTGLVSATWAARIPAVQDRLGLGASDLALVVVAAEGGAVAGLTAGAVLAGRAGSRACLRGGFAAYTLGLAVIAVAPTLAMLVPAVALWAAANSVVDVALNVQGVEIERRAGQPVMSRLHAGHSTGLIAGAGLAAGAAAVELPFPAHFALVAVAACVAGWAATAPLVSEPRGAAGPVLARPDRGVVLLGSIAFCAFAIEGTASSWSAVHLRTDHHAAAGLAAAAYGVFAAAILAGRLAGDRLLARHGRVRVVAAAGALGTVAVAVLILAPVASVALAGWLLLGAAVAPLAPALLGAAPQASRLPTPTAVAATSSIGYLGSFTVPPLVGLLAAGTSVSTALLLLAPPMLAAVALARPALRPAR
jgi:fucose permease